jgi:ABC-type transport system involved in multi-copper enzyme maturation permease subunit
MLQIIAIARNTFKEAIRNRILYVILIFAIILIMLSGVVSKLTIASRTKIILDLGFSSINLFGVAIAIFVGVSLVYNELEKKSIYTIVSKPVARWQFLLGKYFGLLMTVWVNVLVMTFFFLVTLHFYKIYGDTLSWSTALWKGIGYGAANLVLWSHWDYTANIMPVILISGLEMAIVTAFAIFYSSFSTPALSMFFTVLTFIAGRLNEDIVRFADTLARQARLDAQASGAPEHLSPAYYVSLGLAHVVPNLSAFSKAVEQAVYNNMVKIWPGSIAYGILYAGGILCLSMLIFQRRNFK